MPVKGNLALYIGGMGARDKNFYNDYCKRLGYPDAAKEIQDLFLDGKKAEAAAAVPDQLVDDVALVGSRGSDPRPPAGLEGRWRRRSHVGSLLAGTGRREGALRVLAEESPLVAVRRSQSENEEARKHGCEPLFVSGRRFYASASQCFWTWRSVESTYSMTSFWTSRRGTTSPITAIELRSDDLHADPGPGAGLIVFAVKRERLVEVQRADRDPTLEPVVPVRGEDLFLQDLRNATELEAKAVLPQRRRSARAGRSRAILGLLRVARQRDLAQDAFIPGGSFFGFDQRAPDSFLRRADVGRERNGDHDGRRSSDREHAWSPERMQGMRRTWTRSTSDVG